MFTYLKRSKLLFAQVDAAELRMAKLTDQYRNLETALMQQQAQQEQELAGLRETFTSQIAYLSEAVELQHGQQKSLAVRLDQLRDEFSANLALVANQQEQTGHRLQVLETAFSEQRQALEHMAQLLSTHTEQQAAALQAQRKEIETLLAAHTREGSDALGGEHQHGGADRAALTQRSEQLAGKRPRQATGKAPAPQAANPRGKRR
jgi:chromosome segregation ATPase